MQRTGAPTAASTGLLDPGRPASTRRLAFTLIVAVALHALLLFAVSIELPAPEATQRTTRPLEIVVLRQAAPTDKIPDRADAYAQVDREGGGTDADRTATDDRPIEQTPEPPPADPMPEFSPLPEPAAAPTPAQESLPEAQPETALTASKEDLEPLAPPPSPEPEPEPIPEPIPEPERRPIPAVTTAQILASRNLEIAKLSAKIEDDTRAYANRPRRKAISASTREYKYASYLESWRRKVEQVGNLNYPEEAKKQQLYGNLILHVALRSDGSLEGVRVLRSSGFDVLDQAAVRIVELAAPFAPFPPGIRAETDMLDITRTWQFLRTNRLGWEN